MKYIIFLLLCVFGIHLSSAQVQYEGTTGFLYLDAKAYLPQQNDGKALPIPENIAQRYQLRQQNGHYMVDALAIADQLDADRLQELQVQVSFHEQHIWNLHFPVQSLGYVLQLEGLRSIDANNICYPQLDSSRKYVRIANVHAGAGGLPQAYKGEGVIAGIVDGGYDFTHPDFLSEDGNTFRIKTAWSHKDDRGSPPSGYSYGTDYTTEATIVASNTDDSSGWHGAHVLGIMAGSGSANSGKTLGMAPAADIAAVGTNFTTSSISDGIEYIFDYADAEDKPCAINLSIGGLVGPRDGTSAFDQYIEIKEGPGRIVVGAAGNYGNTKGQLRHTFGMDDTLRTFLSLDTSETRDANHCFVYMYTGGQYFFKSTLEIYDRNGTKLTDLGKYYETIGLPKSHNDTIVIVPGQDSLFIQIDQTRAHVYSPNRRSYTGMFVSQSRNTDDYLVALQVLPNGGPVVHVSSVGSGNYSNMVDTLPGGIPMPGFTEGDSLYSVSEVGGTGKETITVASYTTQANYRNILGKDTMVLGVFSEHLNRSPSSSLGPTLDGRQKPNLAAPGNGVTAAYSRFKVEERDSAWINEVMNIGGTDFYWAHVSGTSMATPAVSGTICLMLQANPALDYYQTVNILQQTSYTDQFTTSSIPNYAFGYGKLDAHAAVLMALATVGVDLPSNGKPLAQLYPNPSTHPQLRLAGLAKGATVRVMDMQGKVLHTQAFINPLPDLHMELPTLSTGIYTVQIKSGKSIQTLKWINP